MVQINKCYGDKEIITDSLMSQKDITGIYNTFANECASEKLRETIMELLEDEHSIQMDIYEEMSKRGWYPVTAATQEEVTQVLNKFEGNC